jgi:tetratricopeptide (TPR) repeat protein
MDFVAVVDQVSTLLHQRGRLTYRTLKRQFDLADAALEDLKEELIYGQRLAVDEDERVLVWVGDTAAPMPPVSRHSMALGGFQARCSLTLGEAHLLAGHLEAAHARELQERGNEAYVLRLLGDIAARREPLQVELAATHYQQALALAEELGMRPLVAHCQLGLGTLYAATGRRQQAHTALSTAIALYRDRHITFWLPQTEAALAQVGRIEERSTDHGCEPSKYEGTGDYSQSAPRAFWVPTR